ncbi:MAG: chemotaxis protein CheD [bacterium]
MNKITINVSTGEVKVGKIKVILKSTAIGSCIVIISYDMKNRIGGMAHIMLPGRSPESTVFKNNKTRFAHDAIDELIRKLSHFGVKTNNLITCLIGGANVLKKKENTIADNNISSVTEYLDKMKINITAKILGGTSRRSALFYIEEERISYTEGNSREKLLWQNK